VRRARRHPSGGILLFSAIARVFRTPDLRRKILFTLAIIAIYRLGAHVPTPFVDFGNVQQCLAASGGATGLLSLVNLFSGGALLHLSIFALGVMPYITATIIIQLLRVVIPHFETLYKEGQSGQARLTQYTRYLTIALALLQSTTLVTVARAGGSQLFGIQGVAACDQLLTNDAWWAMMLMILTMTAGTGLIMWFAELVTERGVGNGMSILIFTSIAASFPAALWAIKVAKGWEVFFLVIAMGIVIIALIVFVEQSQRRIPVQYAKRMVGRRTYGGTNTYIPIKVNMAGVVPVIFASSVLYIPALIAQFNQPKVGENPQAWVVWVTQYLTKGDHPLYWLLYFLLIVGFTYFYVAITFNPVEVADNMKKYGGFIPGIRAGRPTAEYLDYVLTRITLPGSVYLGLVALIPLIALSTVSANQNFPFGGTSILIMVGVGLETVKQIDSQLQQRHYEGLLR
jgi:preprotein translocase subunit SecY